MNEKKRKQKQYYVNQAKRARFEKRKLHPGLRGFLCTTNNKERECVREAYNILNEYANQMYGAEDSVQEEVAAAGGTSQDVEQSLEAELAALKEQKVSKERRFQQVESGAKNCIFISTQLEQTAPLVERIAREIRDTGTQRTRYLLRLIPVQVTCKATEEDIRASAESMIKEAFTEIGVSYTTVFRSRNQAQLSQTDAQSAINSLIDAVCPTARLDHKTPTLTVLMEVIRNVICLGVVRDYFAMKKYNLVELAKAAGEEGEGGTGEGETNAEAKGEGGCDETDGKKESEVCDTSDGAGGTKSAGDGGESGEGATTEAKSDAEAATKDEDGAGAVGGDSAAAGATAGSPKASSDPVEGDNGQSSAAEAESAQEPTKRTATEEPRAADAP
ncbi:THUMP domain-containing protein 1-like isoform X1 [Amphibalanus amphitrite]|uniref:THUMP domain-containing protein 1-like isoform X1 n=1 Tax=Amphibalanus amphitrite TaxID=1232801 RepID=UPI001C9252A6|nr:THUMP domain-containing protein 1-like isoform X1 [Amphibalanus amphitrite]